MTLARLQSTRATPVLLAAAATFLLLVLFSWLTPAAFGARGHVFTGTTIGEHCLAEPCEGAKLKEPSGLAVDELEGPQKGDLYVLDMGEAGGTHGRVVRFNEKGEFQSELTGPGATGTGNLTEKSVLIEGVTLTPETGAFTVGEEITAPGLPAETTILAVREGGVLEVSKEASKTEAPASLSAHQAFAFPAGEPEAETSGVAVDNSTSSSDPSKGNVYVLDAGHKLIDKFTDTGVFIGQITEIEGKPLGTMGGVAVDSTGKVWVSQIHVPEPEEGVANYSDAEHNTYEAFRNTDITGIMEAGLAVDSHDDLYVHASIAGIAEYSGTEGEVNGGVFHAKVLNAALDSEPSSGVAVELTTEDAYVDNIATVSRFDQSGGLLERLAVPGGHGGALAVSSSAQTLYVSDASGGVVHVAAPEPPGAPSVEAAATTVSEVTGDSASFSGQVNPRGASTEYRFEYGPCSSAATCATSDYGHSAPVPDAFVGSDFEPHSVGPVHVQELLAGTVYHYRIVAHNVINGETHTTAGEEKIFTTQSAGGEFALPDGRGWELVSPPDKHGAQLASKGQGMIQAGAGGDAMTYLANAPTESAPGSYPESVQVFSTRGGGGWSSVDIAPPSNPVVAQGTSLGKGSQYKFFSADLSTGVVQPFGAFTPCRSAQGAAQPCLSEEATEQTAFLRDSTTGIYTPLVTRSNDTASPFAPFGEEPLCAGGVGGEAQHNRCGPRFVGASADARHIVLQGEVPLTAGSPPASLPCGLANPLPCLYEWGAGTLSFVGSGLLGDEGQFARHAVSDDGSRVVFEGASEGMKGLLLRDTVAPKTWRLDAREPTCAEPECESGGGVFQTASHDGSLAFFTSDRRLTKDAGADVGHGKPDLYVYDVNAPEGHRLTDLTPLGQGSQPAGVHGVLGASEDGSAVYFVANGVQGENPGAVHGTCGEAKPNAVCNLYVLHHESGGWGQPRLIAVLSEADYPDWVERLEVQLSRVSPDGEWLAFQSQRPLTGYDSRDVLTGKPDEEVYLYDAATGGLACASCDPTGARPTGREAGNTQSVWAPSAGLAGTVPGWRVYELGKPGYQPRYLSDQGRLFFNSSDALVPGDVNGQQDVYQYEPQGLGGCTPTPSGDSVVFKPGGSFTDETREGSEGAGCVGLISSGRSAEPSQFLDASVSGADVFFKTAAKLAPQDFDTSADIYDAHICTGESPCTSAPTTPAPCTTESSCKASPTPQPGIFGAPASATFSGLGNAGPQPAGKPPVGTPCSSSKGTPAKACTRAQNLKKALATCKRKYPHSKKRRGGCEAGARKRYGAKATARKTTRAAHR